MVDIDTARERFETATDFTVAVEEEFALVDPNTLALVPMFEQLRDSAAATDPDLSESIAGELISSEIEIRSGRSTSVVEALERQQVFRDRLFRLANENGVALAATGTHPFADYREQRIIDTPHYRLVEEGLKYVAWRNNSFSMHVHVGIKGADRAIQVCDRLRPILPYLLALSANSPFVDGIDSGLHSARSQIFTRSFPRCGIPEAFGSWQPWADYVQLLIDTNSIVEFTQLWWSVRPHHAFGTVEVRICDAQMTRDESSALVELIVGCVRRAAQEIDGGEAPPDLPGRYIEENMWRAIRYGLDGKLLDFEQEPVTEFQAAEVCERLNSWAGTNVVLPQLNGAQRQRRLIASGATPVEVFAQCVKETASYGSLINYE